MRKKVIEALKAVLEIIENNDFAMYVYEEDDKECGIEIESWTPSGVNMIHFLDFRHNKNIFNIYDINSEITRIANLFDVDEEIEIHREDTLYKSAFTYRESLIDFETWQTTLNTLAEKVDTIVSEYELDDKDFENLNIRMSELI